MPVPGKTPVPRAVAHPRKLRTQGQASWRQRRRLLLWSCAGMPLAPASAVGVPKILGQEGAGILARGWHFPGIILVFCWHAPSAILMTCFHEGGAGGAARCGHVRGHGGFPCWYRRLRSYVSKVSARGHMVEV